ncbi:YfcC family protein [Gramella sp. ASW11-100T]|uniref:YfcC family protein n=1 Tax=Christiangramia sediminis TaxID=2881336 RepID=A0A9X1LL38_9FLAO|nr:YfcC family protein [Christiangramia sediminis]
MKSIKFPSAQTLLMIIAAVVAISTWFIPAGNYNTLYFNEAENSFVRNSKGNLSILPPTQETLDNLNIKLPLDNFLSGAIYKPISIPGTFSYVESDPQGFFEFIQAPVKGIIEAADIIFLVLIIGGLIGVINITGAFESGILWLTRVLKGKEYLLIIFTTFIMALGGTTFGLGEETLAFFPILIPVFIAAKYDALVGVACIFLGAQVGVMCSTTNPFAVIIASDAAGVNWTNGLMLRMLVFLICVITTISFILYYAGKLKKSPKNSLIYDQRHKMENLFGTAAVGSIPRLNLNLRLILFVFTLSFIVMIYGVSQLDWWFIEMSSVFLCAALIIGLLSKMNELKFVNAFSRGAGELLGVAFIIGIARGISILMADGLISDTLLYHASTITTGMQKGVFVNSLFVIYNGLTFFIPSTSGMAVLTMPIMSPLADTVNIGREIIVNTYLYGHGLFSIINPTGLVLASLGIVKIGYDRWLKFIWPLLVIFAVILILTLTISVY